MGIFTRVNNNYDDIAPEAIDVAGIDHTLESFGEIIKEFNTDAYKLESALYISDILMDEQVLEGVSPEVLLEGVMGDFFRKIWAMIQKFWAKIKAFFKAVYKYFESLFVSGETFVKKYRKELEDKTDTGFTYTAHKFDLKKGETVADGFFGKVRRDVDEYVTELNPSASFTKMILDKSDGSDYNASEEKEEFYKSLGVDSASDMVEKIREAYMSENKEELKDFEDVSKSEMIKLLSEKSKVLKEFDDDSKALDDTFKKISKALKDAEKNFNAQGPGREKIARHVNNKISSVKTAISIQNSIVATKKDCVGKALKSFQSTLRSYMFYKPKSTKESFDGDKDWNTEGCSSLLDSAMKHV